MQPVDHQAEILLPAQERFAAAGEQHAAVVGIDRLARRLDALDRERAIDTAALPLSPVESSIERPATPVLTARATLTPTLSGSMRKAALEIGIDGQIDRRADRGEMIADVVDGDAVVGLADASRQSPRWWKPAP